MSETKIPETPLDLLVRIEYLSRQAGHKLPEKIEAQPLWRGIAFSVDQLRLVIPLQMITDVVECGPITPVPRTKGWLRGVANVRGILYSVTDLACFLGRPPLTTETQGNLLVLNEGELHSAILVSEVYGLKSFDEERDAGDASTLDASLRQYVSRVFNEETQIWGVLDVPHLVSDEAFREIEWQATA